MSLKLKLGFKIALAAVLTAGAGTGAYAVYTVNASDSIDVPDFSGKAQRIVEIWAKKNNLEDQVKFEQEYSDDVLSDCVISQSARKVSSNGILTFTISQGPDPDKEVELPDFSGKKKDEIEAWFADNYFSNVTYTYTNVTDQDLEDDMFVSMDPTAGTKAKRSDAITVTLATTEIVAPDFSSMSKDDIQKWGDENGVTISFTEKESQILNDGDIMEISAKAGDKLKKGDTVTVTIAKHTDSTEAEKSQEEINRQTTDTNANGGTRDSSYSGSTSNSGSSTSGNGSSTGTNDSGTKGGNTSTTDTGSTNPGNSKQDGNDNSVSTTVSDPAPDSLPDWVYAVAKNFGVDINEMLEENYPGVTFNVQTISGRNPGIASYTKTSSNTATVYIYAQG